jgi:hypothetical protein
MSMNALARIGVTSTRALALALLAAACGDDESEKPDTSSLTPEQLCATKCDREVAAACSQTPADFATSCRTLCMAKYSNFPNCTAAATALDRCALERVDYTCSASGVIMATPAGACAAPGQACTACTNDLIGCI